MKEIREVYPSFDGLEYEYKPLLESMEYEILVKVDEDDYQGDSWVLFKDGTRYGFLNFGWGSCSGCDALQACESLEEIESLRNELHKSIIWHQDKKAMIDWLLKHQWWKDASFYVSDSEYYTAYFVGLALAKLANPYFERGK